MALSFAFSPAFRSFTAERCSAFRREPVGGGGALKQAAVAITLVPADDGSGRAAFVLTERPSTMRRHANQFALPGGRCDDGETAVQAALREIEEEIGLRLTEADVLGALDEYPTRSGYLITPIVVWAEGGAKLTPNPEEVAEIYRIPLDGFATEETVSFVSIKESPRPVIRIKLMQYHLHAPTAAIVYQFCELLAGRTTRVSEFEQPLFAWR